MACMICLETYERNHYCLKCNKPMCETCNVRYAAEKEFGMGCPACRSTGGVLSINIEAEKEGNLVFVCTGAKVTLLMDGERQSFSVSSRAARMVRRRNMKVAREYSGADVYDMVLMMITVVTHAVINNITTEPNLLQMFKERLQTPFARQIQYGYTIHVR